MQDQLAKSQEEIGKKLKKIKHKIVVLSGKGGVGNQLLL